MVVSCRLGVVVRVALCGVLRVAGPIARGGGIAGSAGVLASSAKLTSLCRRSMCGRSGGRWLVAWAVLARSSLVSVLAGVRCGLVAWPLGRGGDR
jgi:hypothetical protein